MPDGSKIPSPSIPAAAAEDVEKQPVRGRSQEKPPGDDSGLEHESMESEPTAQTGSTAWSKKYLYAAIAGAYFLLLINSLQMTIVSSLTPYVTSAFNSHSLIPTTSLVSFVVTGVIQLPLSRVIDLYGRPHGLVAMILLDVLGLVVMATCQGVEAYAAAQVLFGVGSEGILYTIRVFAVDSSTVRSRSFVYGLSMYVYFITPFAGPAIAQAYYKARIWRWAFGSLAIILPAIAAALLLMYIWYAARHPKTVPPPAKEGLDTSLLRSIWLHALDLDVLGILLACFGLSLVLVPLSLSTSGLGGWESPSTISMIVIGVVVIIALVVYEAYFAPKRFIDFDLLRDRTAWGACLCIGGQSLSIYCWWSYYTSFLQVVHYRSIQDAGYVSNAHYVGTACFSVLTGLVLKYTGRFKAATAAGTAVNTLAAGLMILFSRPDSPFGGVVACKILTSVASGILAVAQLTAALNETKDGTVSMRMALLYLFSMIGAAIGSTVATPIWRSRFPHLLEAYLPQELKAQAPSIYGSLEVQLSYERGTEGREAIIQAMTETWRYLTITATATLAISWVGVLLLKEGRRRDTS